MDDDIMEEVNPPIVEVKKNHLQCIRLYYCIQAALAKLTENYEEYKQSITSRVKILLSIIPQKPDFPLGKAIMPLCMYVLIDNSRFYYILWSTSKAH